VNTVIDEYKTLHTNSKLVEESLSELPINYTKEFVNSIITTTNYFIGEMTSYHMVIDPVDTLNFVFPLSIEGIKIRDISECSQGQIGIITLAFNLAMIIELDLNNYPVYVDEIDRNLDTVHKNLLADLINKLVTNKIVSQLFLIAHDQVLIDGFSGDTILLTKDSIEVPAGYNDNVKITYG
jgi:ABC-type Mn2+/Zn2+ transport system ATPase subunit